jgi:four helix bundle protein
MNPPDANKYRQPQALNSTAASERLRFDHEKLDVYRLELEFVSWVTPLIDEARDGSVATTREVCAQLERASLSCLLNTVEGNGKRRRQGRAKFFDFARGSATECAACLDALVAKKVVSLDRILPGKQLLLRIVSMLCRLVDRFDLSDEQLHEDSDGYRIDSSHIGRINENEEENEDEDDQSSSTQAQSQQP